MKTFIACLLVMLTMPKDQFSHAHLMFAKGVRNGCVMTQTKALPDTRVHPDHLAVVDWDYCEKLYWESLTSLKRSGLAK